MLNKCIENWAVPWDSSNLFVYRYKYKRVLFNYMNINARPPKTTPSGNWWKGQMNNSSTSGKHLLRAHSKGSLIHICPCALMISPLKGGGGFLLKDRIILGMLDFSKKIYFHKKLAMLDQCEFLSNLFPSCIWWEHFPCIKTFLTLKKSLTFIWEQDQRNTLSARTQTCKQIGPKQQTKCRVGFLCISAAMIGFCEVFSLRIKNMREKVTPEVYGGPPVQVYPGSGGEASPGCPACLP